MAAVVPEAVVIEAEGEASRLEVGLLKPGREGGTLQVTIQLLNEA